MFINFSNHPSDRWDKSQLNAASKWGEIVDISFPNVDPAMSEQDIAGLATEYIEKILSYSPDAVMCQGEFTLSYTVISQLVKKGITVVAACSKRVVNEKLVDGVQQKEVIFSFEQFRQYKDK
ncbi:MAG: hypothetical protein E7271_09970 [Lachnospiraceae bacterium]|jgi:hypothetical protein|nr:hypothetical protein [Lachnospiraceae bacterium]